jgi:Zc3h12a-like ribonuclease protein
MDTNESNAENLEIEVELEDDAYDDDAGSRRVLVDAANVAHATEGGEARLANIRLVQDKLREEGFEPLVVADAALRHQIDERAEYERLIDDGLIHQAPAGTDADYFILSFAREMDARILTNDRFRDRAQEFPAERDRIIRFMIVGDEVVLERRNRRRKAK